MCRICPKCGSIAEFNAYYGTVICTRCDWESEKLERSSTKYTSNNLESEDKNDKKSSCKKLIKV